MARNPKVGIVWRGSREMRGQPVPETSRLVPIFRALEAARLAAEPAVYCEEASAEVRAQLLGCDGALVWVDPLDKGRDRSDLDALLRDVAAKGVWVSAHPDAVLKIGTKEVLYAARDLGCGGDTALYRRVADFRRAFPERLAAAGARVLKRYRGRRRHVALLHGGTPSSIDSADSSPSLVAQVVARASGCSPRGGR